MRKGVIPFLGFYQLISDSKQIKDIPAKTKKRPGKAGERPIVAELMGGRKGLT